MVPAGHWQPAHRPPSFGAGGALPGFHSSWKLPAGNELCFPGTKGLLAWTGESDLFIAAADPGCGWEGEALKVTQHLS